MQQIKPEFDFLFNNLNKISYILFKPTHFGDVNQKMADFCSCQRSDLRGKPIASILNSQELKTVKKFNQEVFAEGKRKKQKLN